MTQTNTHTLCLLYTRPLRDRETGETERYIVTRQTNKRTEIEKTTQTNTRTSSPSDRFGRGGEGIDMDEVEDLPEAEDSVEKRNRNFLRFGRDRNFLRFGRSDVEDFGLPGGPLAFANGVQDEDMLEDFPLDEKRAGHRNYLRFGRGGIKNR